MDREKQRLEVKHRWEYLKLFENNIPLTAPTDRLLILLPMYINTLKKQIEEVPFDPLIMTDLLDKLRYTQYRLTQINTD
jgi:hypothetical protein